jgi:hypothetical protein
MFSVVELKRLAIGEHEGEHRTSPIGSPRWRSRLWPRSDNASSAGAKFSAVFLPDSSWPAGAVLSGRAAGSGREHDECLVRVRVLMPVKRFGRHAHSYDVVIDSGEYEIHVGTSRVSSGSREVNKGLPSVI